MLIYLNYSSDKLCFQEVIKSLGFVCLKGMNSNNLGSFLDFDGSSGTFHSGPRPLSPLATFSSQQSHASQLIP